MTAQLRPSRLDVTDRYPMLSFTLQSADGPRTAEVVLASDLLLFSKIEGRRSDNFFSSRELGVLTISNGGAVFSVPPQILARFITADRLYFALATASSPGGQDWRIDVMPGVASPYVSLLGLSDRALRRVRMFPASPHSKMGAAQPLMQWAGDNVAPPTPVNAAPQPAPNTAASAPAEPAPYNDGFGPLPPLASASPTPDAVAPIIPVEAAVNSTVAQGLSNDDPETRGIDCSGLHSEPIDAAPTPAIASALTLTAADYPRTARIAPSPAFTAGRNGRTVERIVIHITDGPSTASAVNTFTNAGAQASAHYLVGQDGEVVQFVAETDTAWHARGGNSNSIGIEHVAIKVGGADYPRRDGTIQHFDALAPTDTQYCESAALVSYLCTKYNLVPSRTTIVGHNEVATNHPVCPTGNWNWDHFMRLVTEQVCASQPAAQGLGAARAMDGGTETVEIKYRAFIPSPALSGPFFDNYHGDGRSFSHSSGSSRGELTFLVDVGAGGAVTNLRYTHRDWSPSHSYRSSDTSAVAGKPVWWLNLAAGATPTATASCPTNDDTLRAYIGAPGTTRNVLAVAENASIVSIYMSGNNPIIPGSPAIDADMSVLLRRTSDGGIEAKAYGSHDGFPAHELYVNQHALLTYDPVAAGKDPTALMPPEDIDESTHWVRIASATSALALGNERSAAPVANLSPEDGEISGPVHEIEPPAPAQTAAAMALTAADYPGAIVMPSPAFTRGRSGQTIDRIVIHITSSRQSPHLGTWFTRADANSSAHYMVDQLGAIRQFVSEADTSWHAGNRAMNRRSIGIEHVAVEQGGAVYGTTRLPYTPPSDVEYATSAGLVAHLCRKYNLTPDRDTIIGHSEANPTTTHSSCPNGAWDWDRYMALVAAAYAAQAVVGAVSGAVDAVRGAVGLSAEDWSINWDGVYPVGQPTGKSCWATAAAIIEGWRRRQSVSIESIATFDNLTIENGLPSASHARFAAAVGFTVHPNACYTEDGFRSILEANGPVWVVAKVPGQHAIVVTGMYRKDGQYFVRITDPWDRVVGSPGAPGSYAVTHQTGSQYIMTYAAFAAEFEAAAGSPDFAQLLHTNGTHGHMINRGSASGAGYAQSLGDAVAEKLPAPAIVAAPATEPGAAPTVDLATGVTRTVSSEAGRSYDLAQLTGIVRPTNTLAGGAGMPAISGEQVRLNDWPYIDTPSGRTCANIAIGWKFDGAAVGDIIIAPGEGGSVADGWQAAVRADIVAGPTDPNRTTLLVRVTTTFSHDGETNQTGVSEVLLSGDGRATVRHCGEHGSDQAVPAASSLPAASAPVLVPTTAPEPVAA